MNRLCVAVEERERERSNERAQVKNNISFVKQHGDKASGNRAAPIQSGWRQNQTEWNQSVKDSECRLQSSAYILKAFEQLTGWVNRIPTLEFWDVEHPPFPTMWGEIIRFKR